MRFQLRHLIPNLGPISGRERVRAGLGATLGVLGTGLISHAAIGSGSELPVLIAPMGASAVLLFGVPASPLAQPWSILGGNLLSAVVGVTAAMLIPSPFAAAALAIGVAIALMATFKCLHPPSGAVALTAVLGGPAIASLGYGFVLWPVLANSLLLLVAAIVFNNATGRQYPHIQKPDAGYGTADPEPMLRAAVTQADLTAALEEYGEFLDVDRGDLEHILRDAQIRSYRRRSGRTTCAEIMSRDVVAIAPQAPLEEALELLRRHRVKAIPVTDEKARVVGIVTQTDLLDKAAWDGRGPRLGLGRRIRLMRDRGRAPHGAVEDIMTSPARTVRPDTLVADVVLTMATAGLHHLPVVDRDGMLAGIVSQTDIVATLLDDVAEAA